MGFKIKIKGGKTKSKTTTATTSASTSATSGTQTSTSTTLPVVPEWATGVTRTAADRVQAVANLDPATLVAPASALQRQAAASAAQLGAPRAGPAAPGVPQSASDIDWLSPYMQAEAPSATAERASDGVARYLNPYLHEVVDTTGADMDVQAGRVRAQQDLDLAGSGAFGGSGSALTRSATEGELARARASTLSGLRSQAYQVALNAASADADRASQAQMLNAQLLLQDRAQKVGFGLSSQQQMLAADANTRANIDTQSTVGATQRSIDQAQRDAPVTTAEHVVGMLSNLPIGLFSGTTKTDASTSNSNSNSTTSESGTTTQTGKSLGVDLGISK